MPDSCPNELANIIFFSVLGLVIVFALDRLRGHWRWLYRIWMTLAWSVFALVMLVWILTWMGGDLNLIPYQDALDACGGGPGWPASRHSMSLPAACRVLTRKRPSAWSGGGAGASGLARSPPPPLPSIPSTPAM